MYQRKLVLKSWLSTRNAQGTKQMQKKESFTVDVMMEITGDMVKVTNKVVFAMFVLIYRTLEVEINFLHTGLLVTSTVDF